MIDVPLVSVILPTFNRAHVLGRALRSVINQSYRKLEIIVVDDGSTDDSRAIVESLEDPRIRYLRLDRNRGATYARNQGVHAATGEFIAFQDSDDEWLGDKLKKQMELFEQIGSEVGVVYCGFLRVQGKTARYYPDDRDVAAPQGTLTALLGGSFITTQAAVVRKECIVAMGGFDEEMPRLQDWELFIRLARRYAFACVDEPLLLAHHSPASITADSESLRVAMRMILDKHGDLFARHRRLELIHRCEIALGSFHPAIARFLGRHAMLRKLARRAVGR